MKTTCLLLLLLCFCIPAKANDLPQVEITSSQSNFDDYQKHYYRLTAKVQGIAYSDPFQILHNRKSIHFYLNYETGDLEAFLTLSSGTNQIQLTGANAHGAVEKTIQIQNNSAPCSERASIVNSHGYVQYSDGVKANVNIRVKFDGDFETYFALNGVPFEFKYPSYATDGKHIKYAQALPLKHGVNRLAVQVVTRCDTNYQEFLIAPCVVPEFEVVSEIIDTLQRRVCIKGMLNNGHSTKVQPSGNVSLSRKGDTLYLESPLQENRTRVAFVYTSQCSSQRFQRNYSLKRSCETPNITLLNKDALRSGATRSALFALENHSGYLMVRSNDEFDQKFTASADTHALPLYFHPNYKTLHWKFSVFDECGQKASCRLSLKNPVYQKEQGNAVLVTNTDCQEPDPTILVHTEIPEVAEVGSVAECYFDVPEMKAIYATATSGKDAAYFIRFYHNDRMIIPTLTEKGLRVAYTVAEGANVFRMLVQNGCPTNRKHWFERRVYHSCIGHVQFPGMQDASVVTEEIFHLQFTADRHVTPLPKYVVTNNGDSVSHTIQGNIGIAQIPLDAGFNHITVSAIAEGCGQLQSDLFVTRELNCPQVSVELTSHEREVLLPEIQDEPNLTVTAALTHYFPEEDDSKAFVHVLWNNVPVDYVLDADLKQVSFTLETALLEHHDIVSINVRNACCTEDSTQIRFVCPTPKVDLIAPKSLTIPLVEWTQAQTFTFQTQHVELQREGHQIAVLLNGRQVPFELDTDQNLIHVTSKLDPLLKENSLEVQIYNACGTSVNRHFIVRRKSIRTPIGSL